MDATLKTHTEICRQRVRGEKRMRASTALAQIPTGRRARTANARSGRSLSVRAVGSQRKKDQRLPCAQGKKDQRGSADSIDAPLSRPLVCCLYFRQPHRNRRLRGSAHPAAASGELASRVRGCRACWRRSSTAPAPPFPPHALRARLLDGRRRAFPHPLDLRGDWMADLCLCVRSPFTPPPPPPSCQYRSFPQHVMWLRSRGAIGWPMASPRRISWCTTRRASASGARPTAMMATTATRDLRRADPIMRPATAPPLPAPTAAARTSPSSSSSSGWCVVSSVPGVFGPICC